MASNDIVAQGGYNNHQFVVVPPNDLICLICKYVARDPQQVSCCGKLMCKTCLDQLKRYCNSCPQCRRDITSFGDKKSERQILLLEVKCDNSPHGCEWTGELRLLQEHLTMCDFSLLPCPNECKDGDETLKLLRKDIESHKNEAYPRRQYECPHCQESGEYQERTTTHLDECPRVRILCPNNGCEEEMERYEISQHCQMCSFENIACKYSDIGCTKHALRKDIDKHQDDSKKHLQLALDKVRRQEDQIAQLQSTTGIIKFKITGFNQLKAFDKTTYSPVFYTSPGGYKMCICIDTNGSGDGEGTHVSVYAFLMRGENDDNLPWPFEGAITFDLLNQLEDDNHHSVITEFLNNNEVRQKIVNRERALHSYGCPHFIPHSSLGYNEARNCQYLKDDCLYFRVNVNAKSTSKSWLIII